ncbi:hypothetical protein BDW59DRAFT_79456 [Aspergillus cavernicola]|uniref:Uncharacterized protein n=1 Tax=Aspergillus cavernicola TaxID=176166 RepID=A0ABR4J0A0_9EURO
MGFFFCPWLRYRKPSVSSDLSSYHLDRIGSSFPVNGPPEGISSSIDEQNQFDRHSSSSGGLSGRFRRRFSRDAKDLYQRPKRLERGPKVPFLHFVSKHPAVQAAPVASCDLGGSLMSERGYDSDAQCIATPKHPIYTTEHPAIRAKNGMAMSPRRPPAPPPLREPDMEPSREQAFGPTVENRIVANEQPSYGGEGGESQLSWRPRDHEHRAPQTFRESPSSFRNVDLGSPRGKPLSPCPSVGRARAQERPAPASIVRVQEMHRRPPVPTIGSYEDSTGQRAGHGHDTGGFSYPGHYLAQQHTYTTSADSLMGYPPQLSVRKRHQRPRRDMTLDEQPVQLGEMNIPRMLASSTSTTNMMPHNHPFDDNQSTSNAGTWNANRYQGLNHQMAMSPVWDAPERPAPQPPGVQESRSLYGYDNNFNDYSQGLSGNVPIRPHVQPDIPFQTEETQNSNAENASASEICAADESNTLRSKFTEKFGSDRSVGGAGPEPHRGDNVVSPRKISIGWMSEGRRVGYGYTLVPPDNMSEGHEQTHGGLVLPRGCGSLRDSPKGSLAGKSTEHAGRHTLPHTGKSSQGRSKPSDSGFDISGILQKLNLPRWTGANFGPRTSNASDAGSCDSGGSLFGILTNRKKNREGVVGSSVEADNPWEFCSWVHPVPSSNGQQAPQSTVGSRDYAEAQLIEKLATLRRRGGAWATKRKVSEIARNLEKRAVARLAASTEHHPVVQRTATRVLRLRGPGSKERPRRMHDNAPIYSTDQFDGHHEPQKPSVKPSERASSDTSEDWDSLYEECLEERSIPE